MTSHENDSQKQSEDEPSPTIEEQSGAEGHDQDAEPSRHAPEEEPDPPE